jgi:hypothetical protein
MEKFLWRFYWDCGRSGDLSGLFVATEQEVKSAIGQHVSFGEVLGKHSDVYGTLIEGEIIKVDVSPEAVEEVFNVLGDTWSGFNPLDYVDVQCGNIIDGDRCEEIGNKEDMDAGEIEGYDWLCYSCYRDKKREKAGE